MAVTRLSGGTTPANGSDPRTFPTIWNATADVIEANETAIDSLALTSLSGVSITSPVDNQLLTYNGTNWVNEAPAAPAGSVLQVVSATKTDASFSTTSQSFTTVTGLTATITPTSTSSKILVFCNASMSSNVSAGTGYARLARGGSAIFIGDASSSRIRTGTTISPPSNDTTGQTALLGEDSPATVSATTYALEIRSDRVASTVYVNRSHNNPNNNYGFTAFSSITLMEVAG